jgi:hypothetical protein
MISSLMMLALEANGVIAYRTMKLMRGGKNARREAKLMVSNIWKLADTQSGACLTSVSSALTQPAPCRSAEWKPCGRHPNVW